MISLKKSGVIQPVAVVKSLSKIIANEESNDKERQEYSGKDFDIID